jgi:hypothetical protein
MVKSTCGILRQQYQQSSLMERSRIDHVRRAVRQTSPEPHRNDAFYISPMRPKMFNEPYRKLQPQQPLDLLFEAGLGPFTL